MHENYNDYKKKFNWSLNNYLWMQYFRNYTKLGNFFLIKGVILIFEQHARRWRPGQIWLKKQIFILDFSLNIFKLFWYITIEYIFTNIYLFYNYTIILLFYLNDKKILKDPLKNQHFSRFKCVYWHWNSLNS